MKSPYTQRTANKTAILDYTTRHSILSNLRNVSLHAIHGLVSDANKATARPLFPVRSEAIYNLEDDVLLLSRKRLLLILLSREISHLYAERARPIGSPNLFISGYLVSSFLRRRINGIRITLGNSFFVSITILLP